jgi:dolichol-phosphate mannosyltransferase
VRTKTSQRDSAILRAVLRGVPSVREILRRYIRFLKFGAVGASGVVVNLGVLALLTNLWGMGSSIALKDLAYAISVEVSILTNFLLNDAWTFQDRKAASGPFWRRGLRFHLVSLVGFAVNLVTFAGFNHAFPAFSDALIALPGLRGLLPLFRGHNLFALVGIALATLWNYLGNLHWTWNEKA